MKNIFILIALLIVNTSLYADGLTATLQQNDEMTPFYGEDALKEAYVAADSGAIITLSAGKFKSVDIEKSITIIGDYGLDFNSNKGTWLDSSFRILANNVKIEGCWLKHGIAICGNNCIVKRCFLDGGGSGQFDDTQLTNVLIDECIVTRLYWKNILNLCVKNSTIGYMENNNSKNLAYFTNCVIWDFAYLPSNSNALKYPCAIYKNNFLIIKKAAETIYINGQFVKLQQLYLDDEIRSEFHNNVFCGEYLDSITLKFGMNNVNKNNTINSNQKFNHSQFCNLPTYPIDPPLGSDGTVVGPLGGTGFSEYPSIPRIISKEIDSKTDTLGRLNVKITIKAQ